MMRVVAIVPARDAAGSIGAVIDALAGGVDEVVVVDDASRDATAAEALSHGATVLSLPSHQGKGGAVAAGVHAVTDAGIFLLVDADTGASARQALALVEPVAGGRADMAVGVLPAGATGGFGVVRRLASAGIERACGLQTRAPMSGQRAVRAHLLRGLPLAPRFGLETALTIDAVRAGAAVIEVDVAMSHRRTGRSLAGFAHRAGQGRDVAAVLWRRVPRPGLRLAAAVLVAAAVAAGAAWSGNRAEPTSLPASGGASRVVVFAAPYLSWSDVGTGKMAHLDALAHRGAVAALNVRTVSDVPSSAEAWATVGAGTRTKATPADAVVVNRAGGSTVPSAGALAGASRRAHRVSPPGALAQAVEVAGGRVAIVGNSGAGEAGPGRPVGYEPVALAAMDRKGELQGEAGAGLLAPNPAMAFGVGARPPAVLDALDRALARADVVFVDPGDLERAAAFAPVASREAASQARERALASTDALLGQVAGRLPPSALLLVVSVVPPDSTWRTEPVLAVGAGVSGRALFSTSTGRQDLVTLDDLAPTMLAALGVDRPAGMPGQPLRYRNEPAPLHAAKELDRQARWRESIYFRTAVGYVVFQCLVYLAAAVVHRRRRARPQRALRWAVLTVAAWPLATYALRALPGAAGLGTGAVVVLVAIAIAVAALAGAAGRDGLTALAWLMAATLLVIGVDLATGARLETASIMGYSLHTASRYRGVGNTAFAVLAAAAIILAAIRVERSGRSHDSLVGAGCLLATAVVFVGAPSLGAKVGGTLALAMVVPLAWLGLAGRRLRWPHAAMAAAAPLAVVAAALVDLARPARSRTHLGRFAADVISGRAAIGDTVTRRVAADLHYFKTGWNIAVVAVAIALLLTLVAGRQMTGLLPRGSAARTAAVAVLAAGLLGTALEDSGSIVVAAMFVFLGPWLVLRALDPVRRAPTLVRAAAPATSAAGARA